MGLISTESPICEIQRNLKIVTVSLNNHSQNLRIALVFYNKNTCRSIGSRSFKVRLLKVYLRCSLNTLRQDIKKIFIHFYAVIKLHCCSHLFVKSCIPTRQNKIDASNINIHLISTRRQIEMHDNNSRVKV